MKKIAKELANGNRLLISVSGDEVAANLVDPSGDSLGVYHPYGGWGVGCKIDAADKEAAEEVIRSQRGV